MWRHMHVHKCTIYLGLEVSMQTTINMYMYIYMCVCMHACMHVCMYSQRKWALNMIQPMDPAVASDEV